MCPRCPSCHLSCRKNCCLNPTGIWIIINYNISYDASLGFGERKEFLLKDFLFVHWSIHRKGLQGNFNMSSIDSKLFSAPIASLNFSQIPFQVYLYPWKTNKCHEPRRKKTALWASALFSGTIMMTKQESWPRSGKRILGHEIQGTRTITAHPKNIRAWRRSVSTKTALRVESCWLKEEKIRLKQTGQTMCLKADLVV